MCALQFPLMNMDIYPNKGTISWKRKKSRDFSLFLYYFPHTNSFKGVSWNNVTNFSYTE